ncbi:hypothetical protein EDB83DRAFT_2311235 [Lactarius deliciosus]|nr:hypothetical protein EDB83DRAFT_2311235 [Lactarius deliciosus]
MSAASKNYNGELYIDRKTVSYILYNYVNDHVLPLWSRSVTVTVLWFPLEVTVIISSISVFDHFDESLGLQDYEFCMLHTSFHAPIAPIVAILCPNPDDTLAHANRYLESVDFISISIAFYGLILFYGLTKDGLAGRRPIPKFLSIILIVVSTFYQSFMGTTSVLA